MLIQVKSVVKKYRGIACLYEGTQFKRGRLLWEIENLIVNAALPAIASLVAGDTGNNFISIAGFGSGSTAPALGDTDLGASPKYYNAISSHSYPSSGSAQFNYGVAGGTDYAAVGMTVTELGFFANAGSAGIPAAVGTSNPAWAASTAHAIGDLIADSNGNIQRVTGITSDDKTASSAPAWATSIGTPTTDNHVTWTPIALHTPPTPLYGHLAPVPAFPILSGSSYTGSWTFTA